MFKTVDRGNVRVIQLSQHLCFALETGESFGVVCERFGQNFNGHVAPELGVVRLIDLTHTPSAYLREDAVRAEFCACGKRHRTEWAEFTRSQTGKVTEYGQPGSNPTTCPKPAYARITSVMPTNREL